MKASKLQYLEGDISAMLQEDGTDSRVACPGCKVESRVAIVIFVVQGNLVCHHVLHHPANHLPEIVIGAHVMEIRITGVPRIKQDTQTSE